MISTNSLLPNLDKRLLFISLPVILFFILMSVFFLTAQRSALSQTEDKNNNVQGVNTASKQVTIANNQPQPFTSDWVDVSGYSNITIDLSISNWITNYTVEYSDDQSKITEQQVVICNNSTSCPQQSLSILGKYYRISTGTALGNVAASATLN